MQSRGDVFVGVGIHVRIDAQLHRRRHAGLPGKLIDAFQLGQRLHVEGRDAGGKGLPDFAVGLADAVEKHLAGGETVAQGELHFVAADAFRPEAGGGDGLHEPRLGIGLQRIVDVYAVALRLGGRHMERATQQRHVIPVERGFERGKRRIIPDLKHMLLATC